MARIEVNHHHQLSQEEAAKRLESLANELSGRYPVQASYQDGKFDISGPGVQGELQSLPGQITGFVDVPFFLKGKVEQTLQRRMEEEFPSGE